MSSTTTNTPEIPANTNLAQGQVSGAADAAAQQAVGNILTPANAASGNEAQTSAAVPTPHHHILAGVATTFEGFARLLEKEFAELASEIKALAAKIRAKL